MKKFGILVACVLGLSLSTQVMAQNSSAKKAEKKVEVNIENGETTVVITTTDGKGEVKEEIYTGDEAKAKLKELESEKGNKTKVFAFSTEDEEQDANGNKVVIRTHVSNDDNEEGESVDVQVKHEGNKVIIVKTEDGKETVKEINLPDVKTLMEDVDVDWKELHKDIKKSMEEAGIDLKELHKELSDELKNLKFDISIDDEDGNVFFFKNGEHSWHGSGEKVIINEEELTPEEIQEKYGVAIDEADEDVVIVKHIIKVKREGEKESQATDINNFVIGKNEVKIYPNPGKSDIQIDFNTGNAKEAEIRLIDMNGKQLMKRTVKGKGAQKEVLNTSKYPAGTYLVELKIGGEKIIQQIILE